MLLLSKPVFSFSWLGFRIFGYFGEQEQRRAVSGVKTVSLDNFL